MANKNRDKGHRYERELRQEFIEAGFTECQTARYASKMVDDSGVDFVGLGDLNVQAKYYDSPLDYWRTLDKMPINWNASVVFHKKSRLGEVVVSNTDLIDEVFGQPLLLHTPIIKTPKSKTFDAIMANKGITLFYSGNERTIVGMPKFFFMSRVLPKFL